jgi:hypothetical protein
MKRRPASRFAIGAICFVMCAAGSATRIAIAAEGGASALEADKALREAIAKKDVKGVGALLDQQFTWTTENGQTRKRAEFLKVVAALWAASAFGYSDVKEHAYGQLNVVTGTSGGAGQYNTFFADVWVKRPAGWLLLTHQDTAIVAKGAPGSPASASAPGDSATPACENPCRTLPVTPRTNDEKQVFKAYQAVETAVTSHDAKSWAYHVADEFVGIGRQYTGAPDTKAGRVGQIGIVSNRVVLPPMLRGEAFVFGDAAIILADHQPAGEPPYHVIRVWVNRGGRWQLFHRQETTIQAGAQ